MQTFRAPAQAPPQPQRQAAQTGEEAGGKGHGGSVWRIPEPRTESLIYPFTRTR